MVGREENEMQFHLLRSRPPTNLEIHINEEREASWEDALISNLWSTAPNHHTAHHHQEPLPSSGEELLNNIMPDSTRGKPNNLELNLNLTVDLDLD
jgi:hypothetical protein